MLIGAFSFSDRVDARLLVKRLAALTRVSEHQQTRMLWEDARFACATNERSGSEPGYVEHRTDGSLWTCLGGNLSWSRDRIEASLAAAEATPADLSETIPGHWVGVRYDSARASVELFSDRLGIGWTYIAKTAWGYAFGPDFGALVAATGVSAQPDRAHIMTTLALGYAFDESTCLEAVRLLPAGAVMRISRDREQLEFSAVRYPAVDRMNPSERAQAYAEALAHASRTWIESDLSATDISLSAGLDCRYGLGLMLESGHRPKGFTFGHPRSGEVRGAKRVARAAGISTQVYEIGPSRWEGWQQCVTRSGAVGGFHWPDWTGWLQFLAQHSNRILIGFLGDAFSGKHWVPASDASVSANVRAWFDGNVDQHWLQSDLLATGIRNAMQAHVSECVSRFAESADYSEGFQAQLHLDWYGRQRRFTAAQPNLMHSVIGVVPFLYHPAMMDFWSTVPLSDLKGQALYRNYAATRFPELFSPATSRPSLAERISGSARNALASLGPRWKSRFAPIVLDPEAMVVEQKQQILNTLRAAGDKLSWLLDMDKVLREVERFPQSGLRAMQVRRLVNVAILLQAASGATERSVSNSGLSEAKRVPGH